jgi:hypothetical protein
VWWWCGVRSLVWCGVILPSEILELHQYGITRIYSPDDGRAMGLQGMINDLVDEYTEKNKIRPSNLKRYLNRCTNRLLTRGIMILRDTKLLMKKINIKET